MSKGKFIVLDGIDGSGTSTQIKLLSDFLQEKGLKVKLSHEPTSFAIGQEIRKILSSNTPNDELEYARLALMFAADRMDHVCKVIKPALENYDFVILDRYVLSSLVYQGLSMPLSWVEEINHYAIKPDLTIVMDLNPEDALKRLEKRASTKDFFEEINFLKKLSQRYLDLAHKDASCVILESSGTINDVHSKIVKQVLAL